MFSSGSLWCAALQPDKRVVGHTKFKHRFDEVLIPHVHKVASKKVALIMRNCRPYRADLVDPRGQIKIVPLLPNCMIMHKPMNQGIIAAWKVRYRYQYPKEILDNFK